MATIEGMLAEAAAPSLNLKTSRALRSSDGEFVTDIETMHSQWLDADADNRERLYEALGAFYDINGGAWRERDRNELIAQGRHPVSLNIAEQKLRSLAGHIRSEKWDFNFFPMDLKQNSLIKNIKWWYYADKEQYNYEYEDSKTLIRGLINAGYDEIDIHYDIRPTGAICFPSCLPGTVLEDPYWQTSNLKDWRRAMKDAWMTPAEIIEKYECNDPRLMLYDQVNKLAGETYEATGDVRVMEDVPHQWGSKLLVIEYRWLEKLKTSRLYVFAPNGDVVPLPLDVDESDVRNVMAMLQVQSWEQIKEFPYEDDILYISAICPQVGSDLILTKGKHVIQCGTIGFFPFSGAREMGVNKGVFEAMLDLQRTLNYREMKKDDIIASGAAGGLIVNKSRLGSDPDTKLRQIQENRTRTDFVLGVDGPATDIVSLIPSAEVPQNIWSDLATLVDMFDRVAPVTPALEGQTSKDESGILFEMRHAVSKLGILILYDNWQQHLMDKAEAWYRQAQITYKGLYRQIVNRDTNEIIEFNCPAYRDNQKVYVNSVDQLPTRAQIIVSLSKSSPTEQFATRNMLYDVAKMLAGHGELFPEEMRYIISKFLESTELSLEDKAALNQMSQMKQMRDFVSIMTQIKELESRGINADVMIQQAQAMLQQGGAPQAAPEEVPESAVPAQQQQLAEATPLQGEGQMEPGQPIQTSRGEFVP